MLKPSSISEKFETEYMDSYERNDIYIPELGMTMGSAWGSLKKTWVQLKLAYRNGDFSRVELLKERIHLLREGMGLPNEELY